MLIDARQQFEKEPKSFGNKRNRSTDAHRAWIEERYRDGWAPGYADEQVKLFNTTDFAYHKVSVVFWQTDENDQPAIITEPYEKTFTAQNIKKEQEFYDSELKFDVRLTDSNDRPRRPRCHFTLKPEDSFPNIFEQKVKAAFKPELDAIAKNINEALQKKKAVKKFFDGLSTEVEWTHRHYVKDDEYIPYGEDIETFLKREIGKTDHSLGRQSSSLAMRFCPTNISIATSPQHRPKICWMSFGGWRRRRRSCWRGWNDECCECKWMLAWRCTC